MAEQFIENYKSATTILAEYQLGNNNEIIAIEKRKSSRQGCELYTEISGKKYRVYSGLFRGCLQSLMRNLSPNAKIAIIHTLPGENENGATWLNIRETLLLHSETIENSRESVLLVLSLDGTDFQTKVYDIEDTLDALKELKDILNTHGIKVIKVCPYCVYINYYSNKSLCIRDLEINEIQDTNERIRRKKEFFEYYGKIAWDIEEFHFCSAFLEDLQ